MTDVPHRVAPRKNPYFLPAIVLITLLVGGLSWYCTSFKRPLTVDQVVERLESARDATAKDVQHALYQYTVHAEKKTKGFEKCRPLVVKLVEHPETQVRNLAAWAMQMEELPEYKDALLRLLADAHPAVRRNAALGVSKYSDPAARGELLAALEPVEITAQVSGELDHDLKVGNEVSTGRALGTVKDPDGKEHEIRSPFNGYVKVVSATSGSRVAPGAKLITVSQDPSAVLNALVALGTVGLGRKEDIPRIEPFAQGRVPHMPDEAQTRARQTIQAIERRGL